VIGRTSCRPDFMMPVYPVITVREKGRQGARDNLLDRDAKPELVELFSNEKRITGETPRAFLAHALDDRTVPSDNSQMLYEALWADGVEAHDLDSGGHGLEGFEGAPRDAWQALSLEWLAAPEIIPSADVA
jgi:acetyl esterase/lipase